MSFAIKRMCCCLKKLKASVIGFKDDIKQALYFRYDQNPLLKKIYDEHQSSQMSVASYFVAGQLFSNILFQLKSVDGVLKDK